MSATKTNLDQAVGCRGTGLGPRCTGPLAAAERVGGRIRSAHGCRTDFAFVSSGFQAHPGGQRPGNIVAVGELCTCEGRAAQQGAAPEATQAVQQDHSSGRGPTLFPVCPSRTCRTSLRSHLRDARRRLSLRGRVRDWAVLWSRCGLVPKRHGVRSCRTPVAWKDVRPGTSRDYSHERGCAAGYSSVFSAAGTRADAVRLAASVQRLIINRHAGRAASRR